MLKREDYRNIKGMDRFQMERYLETIYRRGYEAGMKAATSAPKVTKEQVDKANKKHSEELPLTAAEEAAEVEAGQSARGDAR